PTSPGVEAIFASVADWGQDLAWVSADPALGFESIVGYHDLPVAPTIQQIDSLATELIGYFNLTSVAPTTVQGGGIDLAAAISPDWWAPDPYWSLQLGTPYDFFGSALSSSPFSLGASQYLAG